MNLSASDREFATKRDVTLIERITHGDERALEDLYVNHSRLVYSLALNTVGIVADAEEVTQEVFLKVWRKADSFDPKKGTPLAWIVTITRRLAIDRTRSKGYNILKRSTGMDDAVIGAIDKENISNPDNIILERLREGEVKSNLSQLTEKQLKVIHLSYYESMSHSEISECLNIPLGTVKSRMREAIGQLRKIMEVQSVNK